VGVLGVVTKVCLFNRAVLCTLGKVRKPGMALKDKQLMAVQHVHNGKDMYVWLPTGMSIPCLCILTICIRTLHPLWKGRSVYYHHSLGRPRFCMVQLHITFIYFTEYFSVLLPASSAYVFTGAHNPRSVQLAYLLCSIRCRVSTPTKFLVR